MRDIVEWKHPSAIDLVVQIPQPVRGSGHGEVGDRPDHPAQEEHHGSDIRELETETLVSTFTANLQAGCACLIGFDVVISAVAGLDASEEELTDLDIRPAANVLREVGAPWLKAPSAISDQCTVTG